jgi:hypothetical protein
LSRTFKKKSDSCITNWENVLRTRSILFCISLSPVTKRLKCGRMPSIATLGITPNAIIQHSTASNGRIGICLKVKGLYDGVWLKDHGHIKINSLAR